MEWTWHVVEQMVVAICYMNYVCTVACAAVYQLQMDGIAKY